MLIAIAVLVAFRRLRIGLNDGDGVLRRIGDEQRPSVRADGHGVRRAAQHGYAPLVSPTDVKSARQGVRCRIDDRDRVAVRIRDVHAIAVGAEGHSGRMESHVDRPHDEVPARIDHRDRPADRNSGSPVDHDREHSVGEIVGAWDLATPVADVHLRAVGRRQDRVGESSDGNPADDLACRSVDHRHFIQEVERDVQPLASGCEREPARRRIRDRNRAVGSEQAVRRRGEDLDVVARPAAHVDPVPRRAKRYPHEAVGDRDRLQQCPRIHINDVQRSRVEVAARHDGEQVASRVQHHPEGPIVDLDVLAGRRQRLPGRYQYYSVGLHPYDYEVPAGETRGRRQCQEREPQHRSCRESGAHLQKPPWRNRFATQIANSSPPHGCGSEAVGDRWSLPSCRPALPGQ